jgi:diaminohydroxyphosphoribosylaminopyrimidine deaminase/5-amino-6-(5-phosphoribosylamino)uracil reductase
LAQTAREDVLLFTQAADASRTKELEKLGVRVEKIARSGENALDLSAALCRLGETEITSLLMEGGSHLNASVLDSGLADKVFLFLSPKIFGDTGVPFAAGLNRSITFTNSRFHEFGDDCAIEGYLKDPYSE